MKDYNIVIIGGGPAGFFASILAKNKYREKSVVLIRKNEKQLIPCAIPYIPYTLKSVDKDLLPDYPLADAGVDLLIDEVTSIDRDKKIVRTSGGREIRYEKLIIATGSSPSLPPIKGIELSYPIFKDYGYLTRLSNEISKAKDITIVGGGFVGVELCDELVRHKKKVRVIEILPHILQIALDEDFCLVLEKRMRECGIELLTNSKISEIKRKDDKKVVILEDGTEIETDLVIITTGTKPNIDLAKKCGLDVNLGIKVNNKMQTNDKDIFAIGDCAEKTDFLTGKPKQVMLATIAITEAIVAVENLFKDSNIKMKGILGTFLTKFDELIIASTGYTENNAKDVGIDVITGKFETYDCHPITIPGAEKLRIKLVFTKDCRLIGAQIIGGKKAIHLINLLSVLIENNYTIEKILNMQFSTHPWLTPSPIAFPIIRATLDAAKKLK